MAKKILITRLAGLGDVACILIPAVRLIRRSEPAAQIDVLTYGAGVELMSLCEDVANVLSISEEQWPRDLLSATESFVDIAKVIAVQDYERIICLDTWFMPCFLARVLRDVGLNVEGNMIDMPVRDFFQKLHGGKLHPAYFEHSNFMTSTYPRMGDWSTAWWLNQHDSAHYPEFYLKHCCGFGDDIVFNLPVESDAEFRTSAAGKKIIAVSFKGSTAFKSYPYADQLVQKLEDEGYVVWSGFDGSLPMRTTLGRLAVTDLLITVATSTQWLGKLVGCPSLMLPGAMHPATLGAEITADKVVDCQYCCQRDCPTARNFACTYVPILDILGKVSAYFSSTT